MSLDVYVYVCMYVCMYVCIFTVMYRCVYVRGLDVPQSDVQSICD